QRSVLQYPLSGLASGRADPEPGPAGQVRYRNDKNGIIHTTIGKVDFDADKLKENLEALLVALKKAKPTQAKGVYIKKVSISTTMGAGVAVDQAGLSASVN
ncbi:hypothetical protein ACUOA8_38160, partial [Escherichia sp. SS-MK2]